MTDTERRARHKQLAALLARADRLTVDEAALLREHFATELAIADAARRTAGGVTAENQRLRQQIATAEGERDAARVALARALGYAPTLSWELLIDGVKDRLSDAERRRAQAEVIQAEARRQIAALTRRVEDADAALERDRAADGSRR